MKKTALLALLAALTAVCLAQSDHVPAYNRGPLKPGEVVSIMPADQLPQEFQNPYQVRAYQLAAKIPDLLNQMPCYCYWAPARSCLRERTAQQPPPDAATSLESGKSANTRATRDKLYETWV
jgi:hypothetical protein